MDNTKKLEILEAIRDNKKYSKNKRDIHYLVSNGYLEILTYKISTQQYTLQDGSVEEVQIKRPDTFKLSDWAKVFILMERKEV